MSRQSTKTFNRRSVLQFACAGASLGFATSSSGAWASVLVGGPVTSRRHQSKQTPSLMLVGDYGYQQQKIRNLPPGTTIDATKAFFTVANSRNGNPEPNMNCNVGRSPINLYPVSIRNSPGVEFIGGRFNGEVPVSSDWRSTYCNSAALLFRDGSSKANVHGIRMRRCWDGVRFANHCGEFELSGSWLSEVRDDAVENDHLYDGTVRDCLFDGCFSGISLDPASMERDGSTRVITVDRCLIRMQAFPYGNKMTHGSPFKVTVASPLLRLTNTVIALSSANMRFTRLERTWARLCESRNNVLMWLSDAAFPPEFPFPPSGFRLLSGVAAQDYWEQRRRQWIDSHPGVPRFSDDL